MMPLPLDLPHSLSSRPLHLPRPLSGHPPHLVHPQTVKDVIDLALRLGKEEEELDEDEDEDVVEALTVRLENEVMDEDVVGALMVRLEDEVMDVGKDVGKHVQLTLKAQHRRRMMIGSGVQLRPPQMCPLH